MGTRHLQHRKTAFACLLASGVGSVPGVAQGSSTPAATAAREALRQADALRAREASEAQAWQAERARMELLLATVNDRIREAKAEKKTQTDRILALREAQTAARPLDERRKTLAQVARETAARVDATLERVHRRAPPGVVPESRPASAAGAAGRLDAALDRLERAERAASRIHVTLATGRLGSEEVAVEVLTVGAAAAWYCTLDDSGGGLVAIVDGALILRPTGDPRAARQIEQACAIAKGRAAPRVVVLPVAPFETNETDGRPAP